MGRRARASGRPAPELVIVKSPYRMVVGPILTYLREVERKHPDRAIAVVNVPWYIKA